MFIFGVKMFIFEVKMFSFGVKMFIFGVKMFIFGVKMFIFGVNIRFGPFLSSSCFNSTRKSQSVDVCIVQMNLCSMVSSTSNT
jgi:hypothetical protein